MCVCVSTHHISTTARWISIIFFLNGSYQLCADDTFSDFRNFTFYHFYSKNGKFSVCFSKKCFFTFSRQRLDGFRQFFFKWKLPPFPRIVFFPISEILLFTSFIVKNVNFQCVFSNFKSAFLDNGSMDFDNFFYK